MATITNEQVLGRLRQVKGPDLEGNIVDLQLVSDIFIADGKVYFSITVPASRAEELEPMRAAAEKVVLGIDGVKSAMVTLTAARRAGDRPAPPPPQQEPRAVARRRCLRPPCAAA